MDTSTTLFRRLARRLHRDERGAVTLETVLIVGAIALPVLIFVLKFGWPRIRNYFQRGMENLEEAGDAVVNP
jgi:Flp pilus assembly pilin Flp